MASAKFQPLGQSSDDYRLDNLSQQPHHFSNDLSSDNDLPRQPTRWASKKSHVTYVSTPDDSSGLPFIGKQGRRRTGDSRRFSRLSFLANPVSNFRIPTFAAPWQHGIVDATNLQKSKSTVRVFSRSKQWRRIFVNGFLQWLLTVTIVVGQFAALFGFSRPSSLNRYEKYSFNAIITLLSLFLGLAVVMALRSYAKLLSWRFLASGYRNLQDFELVMNCDSQSKVLKLLWAGRKQGRLGLNKTQLLCILSLFLVIGLQITIGMLGLTYSIDSGQNEYDYAYGNVSLVDLSNIYQDPTYYVTTVADQTGAANYYGLVGQNYYIDDSYPLGEGADGQDTIYTADNKTYFYNLVDMAVPDPKVSTQAVSSSARYVTFDVTCVELKITSGGYINMSSSRTALSFKDEHGKEDTIWINDNSILTSTYMSNSTGSTCGERCTNIYILDTGNMPAANTTDPNDKQVTPHFYSCNSTVSQVFNSNTCSYEPNCTLSDEHARYLAGAIGWNGNYYIGDDLQYKTYPPGSPNSWDSDPTYTNATLRAQQVAQFSANALAAMDDVGPRITMTGRYPKQAVSLSVEWNYAIPVLCVVPAVQFVVLIIVCIYANGALIKDGGYLSAARLLRPVVDKLEEHGCALTSDELARELGNFRIVYGARAPPGRRDSTAYSPATGDDVDWHVGVIAESEGFGTQPEEGWGARVTFPEGRYDGVGGTINEESGNEDVSDEKVHLLHQKNEV